MLKEDRPSDGAFLNTVKGMKELGLIGPNQKSEDSVLVKILQQQLTNAQKDKDEYKQLMEEIRDATGKERIEALNKEMELKLAMIARDTMSVEDWENLQRKRREWAKEQGFVSKSEFDSNLTKEDRSLKRIETAGDRFEKLPDKFSEAIDKSIDKLMNTFDKLSQVQERRRLSDMRREHLLRIQLSKGEMPSPSPSQLTPDEFLTDIEGRIDDRTQWQKLNKKADDLEKS